MRYNHFDMLPEKAFSPVGKRMTLEGGGGGGQKQQSSTGIDPILKPYVSYGLEEAKNLYQGASPQYYAGQTYVSPSANTTSALTAAGNRAVAGNPLLPAAQANAMNLQTATNQASPMYQNLYRTSQTGSPLASSLYGNLAAGNLTDMTSINRANQAYANAQTNPALAGNVYSGLASGQITNAANPYNQATAGGAYLGANPYFTQALQGAGQAAASNYYDAINQANTGASQAGRYGSGAQENLFNRAGTTLANSLANKAGELGYNQYANERALQEAAMGRLGQLSQSDIANQLAGATALTGVGQQTLANQMAATNQGAGFNQQALTNALAGAQSLNAMGQQDFTNRLAATGGLATTNAADLQRQMAAAQLAPELANADYTDINQLLKTGQAQEDYANTALQADINRFNYNENLPTAKLNQYAQYLSGTPQGSTTTSTSSGGKIVCTAMNQAYGFGSFRQAIWLQHSATMPNAKTIEKGYHTLFLPVVAYAFNGTPNALRNAVRRIAEHIARHRTADLWKEMRGKKRDPLGRIYRAVIEPICYLVGKAKGA
jgi:hypothetical protein